MCDEKSRARVTDGDYAQRSAAPRYASRVPRAGTTRQDVCRKRGATALAVALLALTLMLFGAVHDAEHGLHDAGVACIAVGAVAAVWLSRRVVVPPAPIVKSTQPYASVTLAPRTPIRSLTRQVPLRL